MTATNGHCRACAGTGRVECWSPGGPCQTRPCEACGPCTACERTTREPWFVAYERAGELPEPTDRIDPPVFEPLEPVTDNACRVSVPVVDAPTLIGPFGGEHPPLPPNAPRWRRILRGVFRFANEAGYTLLGGR